MADKEAPGSGDNRGANDARATDRPALIPASELARLSAERATIKSKSTVERIIAQCQSVAALGCTSESFDLGLYEIVLPDDPYTLLKEGYRVVITAKPFIGGGVRRTLRAAGINLHVSPTFDNYMFVSWGDTARARGAEPIDDLSMGETRPRPPTEMSTITAEDLRQLAAEPINGEKKFHLAIKARTVPAPSGHSGLVERLLSDCLSAGVSATCMAFRLSRGDDPVVACRELSKRGFALSLMARPAPGADYAAMREVGCQVLVSNWDNQVLYVDWSRELCGERVAPPT